MGKLKDRILTDAGFVYPEGDKDPHIVESIGEVKAQRDIYRKKLSRAQESFDKRRNDEVKDLINQVEGFKKAQLANNVGKNSAVRKVKQAEDRLAKSDDKNKKLIEDNLAAAKENTKLIGQVEQLKKELKELDAE